MQKGPTEPSGESPPPDVNADLLHELRRCNELIERWARVHESWKIPLRNGLLAGLGSVIGATILVSLLLLILKPFSYFEAFKPTLERIAIELERPKKP